MEICEQPKLSVTDCLAVLDHLDESLALLARTKNPTTLDVQIKSMLTVVRREIADRIIQVAWTNVRTPTNRDYRTVR